MKTLVSILLVLPFALFLGCDPGMTIRQIDSTVDSKKTSVVVPPEMTIEIKNYASINRLRLVRSADHSKELVRLANYDHEGRVSRASCYLREPSPCSGVLPVDPPCTQYCTSRHPVPFQSRSKQGLQEASRTTNLLPNRGPRRPHSYYRSGWTTERTLNEERMVGEIRRFRSLRVLSAIGIFNNQCKLATFCRQSPWSCGLGGVVPRFGTCMRSSTVGCSGVISTMQDTAPTAASIKQGSCE